MKHALVISTQWFWLLILHKLHQKSSALKEKLCQLPLITEKRKNRMKRTLHILADLSNFFLAGALNQIQKQETTLTTISSGTRK